VLFSEQLTDPSVADTARSQYVATHPEQPLLALVIAECTQWLQDLFDRGAFGLVLIGMPGLEKRLPRYLQLYSRVGFVHHYRTLRTEEMRAILLSAVTQLVESPQRGLSEPAVLAEILRITGGNLRLVVRLLTQIALILEVNDSATVTVDIV
jgi:hypothetical protein